MRIPAFDGVSSRLAKLAAIPVVGLVLAACTEQANTNKTSDAAAPNLFGETANGIGFPHEVVTSEGIASAGLYLPIFLIAVAIFILIEGLLLLLVFRYRRKDGDDSLPEQTHGNNTLEIVWTAIPALIVTLMFVGSTLVLTDVEAKSDDPDVVVEVVAQQFGWTFTYQDYDSATGEYVDTGVVAYGRTAPPSTEDPAPPGLEMVLPVDQDIRFRVTAQDVIHSFYVPAFFFKRDAIPGRLNEFELTIEEPGTYGGQCAEFCGLLHGQMFFTIRAVPGDEYAEWVAAQTAGATAAADAAPAEEAEAGDTTDTEPGTAASEEAA